jgi:hypothetical protein
LRSSLLDGQDQIALHDPDPYRYPDIESGLSQPVLVPLEIRGYLPLLDF